MEVKKLQYLEQLHIKLEGLLSDPDPAKRARYHEAYHRLTQKLIKIYQREHDRAEAF